jgi:Kef-type K+ transport system membrane component KefB
MRPVPPLAPHSLLVYLAAIAVLLGAARLLGRLAARIGMLAIVGELATGVVLGPSLLLHVFPGASHWLFPAAANQMHLLDGIAQVGAVLLVGVTGTQLDLRLLRHMGDTALTVSGLGLIVPLVLGVTLGLFLPATVVASGHTSRVVLALFIGVTMCVSATPVIAKTLSDMRLLHRNLGQLILAAGSIDDAVGWLLLSVVSAAATNGVRAGHVLVGVACLIAFVLLAASVGRVGVKKVLTMTTRADEPGPTVAAAVVIILAGAVTTAALGMEPIFGAFIAGTVISASRIAQRQLAALRTLVLSVLAPLFLATAGLRVDVTVLARPVVALTALVIVLVAIFGKFAGAYAGARLRRLSSREGIAVGAGMNARGIVEVVIALTGLRLGVINTTTYTIVVLVALVTSTMAPPVLRHAMSRITQTDEELVRKIDHDTWDGDERVQRAA